MDRRSRLEHLLLIGDYVGSSRGRIGRIVGIGHSVEIRGCVSAANGTRSIGLKGTFHIGLFKMVNSTVNYLQPLVDAL